MKKDRLSEEKITEILDLLKREYPDAGCALVHRNVFELIVCVVLSAQTTDVSVNGVSRELFDRYPDAESLASASAEDVIEIIKTIGMYRTKSKNIIALAKELTEKHGGKVPQDYDALVALPGVGRKTANVIRGNIYHDPSIVVDTHVGRISRRLGFTEEKDPAKVEGDLMKKIPREHWIAINIQFIALGRSICTARSPKCQECFLSDLCGSCEL